MEVKIIATIALTLSILAIIIAVMAFSGTASGEAVPLGLLGTPNSCSDTDGGKVYTIKGTVSGYYNSNPYSYTDYCTSGKILKEYYCSSKRQYSTSYTCSGTKICVDGACVQQTTTTTTPVPTTTTIPDSCSDTDGGQVYTVKGTVSGYRYGNPYSYTDYCINPSNSTSMYEYYCSGNTGALILKDCATTNTTTTCADGACV